MAEVGRLPEVLIIGAMKSATTSLYRWLDEQPEVFMARPKETNFFTDRWGLGRSWYEERFADAPPDRLLGEASVNYTSPEGAAIAADRMAALLPNARLISVLRHPVDRVRSHYRHEVQRHRESRSLIEALRENGNTYTGHSSYGACLQPYIDRFPREHILVLRFEDLVESPAPAWSETLEFLSLADRPAPEEAHNVSSEKAQWTWAMAWAKRRGVINLGQISRLPAPVRRAGKAVFARGGASYARKLDASRVPIPDGLLSSMWDDVRRLEEWLGTPLWSPASDGIRSEPAR